MLPKINPTNTTAWKKLAAHHETVHRLQMKSLFAEDPRRFERFSIRFNDILVDFSKNRITAETLGLLIELAGECGLPEAIAQMFAGARINETENRAVLHVALAQPLEHAHPRRTGRMSCPRSTRCSRACGFLRAGPLGQLEGLHRQTHHRRRQHRHRRLGPRAGDGDRGLRPYANPACSVHFVSNVDGTHIAETLKGLNPEKTLFMVASKTFTTQETMTNACTARRLVPGPGAGGSAVAKHFVAHLDQPRKRWQAFGIDPDNMFVFWDWVGGRYSLWSAIGLSIACAIGIERFEELLAGAHDDGPALPRQRPSSENLPVILALIGIWYTNFFGAETAGHPPLRPVHASLSGLLSAGQHGEQRQIASTAAASASPTPRGPIVWGEPGTNGQHAFYQLIHQGTRLIPCRLSRAGPARHNPLGEHHRFCWRISSPRPRR